jgi:hypothetical protein
MSSIQARDNYKVGDFITYKRDGIVAEVFIYSFHPTDTSLVVSDENGKLCEIDQSEIIKELAVGDNVKTVINGVKEDATVLSIHPTDGSICVFIWSNGKQREITAFERDAIYGGNILDEFANFGQLIEELDMKLREFHGELDCCYKNTSLLSLWSQYNVKYNNFSMLANFYAKTRNLNSLLDFCKLKYFIAVFFKRMEEFKHELVCKLEELCL